MTLHMCVLQLMYAQCVSMCMRLHALDGGTHCTKWIPVDKRSLDRSLWTVRVKREDDEDEGWWRLADGLQQPANEEPSEASIHLEHGPLQLP